MRSFFAQPDRMGVFHYVILSGFYEDLNMIVLTLCKCERLQAGYGAELFSGRREFCLQLQNLQNVQNPLQNCSLCRLQKPDRFWTPFIKAHLW